MKFMKEVVHGATNCSEQFLSATLLARLPYADAKILKGAYSILDKNFWVQRIAHRGYHVLVLSILGTGEFIMNDGTRFLLEAGNAFLSHASGQAHLEKVHGNEPWHCIWLDIDETTSWGIPEIKDWQLYKFSLEKQLSKHFLSAIFEDHYHDVHSALAQELYTQLFLITLRRCLGWTEELYSLQYRKQFSLLWQKVASDLAKPWSITDLCKEMNLSKSHLTRLCLELYQMSPGLRVRFIKMDQAKVLIENTELSFFEVAEMVGFSNPSTFSTAFKRYYGYAPRELRKNKNNLD